MCVLFLRLLVYIFYVFIVSHCVECDFCVSQSNLCYNTLINVQTLNYIYKCCTTTAILKGTMVPMLQLKTGLLSNITQGLFLRIQGASFTIYKHIAL